MPVEVKQLSPNAYVMSFHGRVNITELENAYREAVALKDASYLLVDSKSMIYEDEVMFSETLLALMHENVARETTKGIIVVLSEGHPAKEPITQLYDNFGFLHKLHYAETREEGVELISDLLAR